MNELFEFRKHLNTKKVIGIIIFIAVFIVVIINFFLKSSYEDFENDEISNPYKTYSSIDHKISIELPKRYKLNEKESNHILKLESDDGLVINIEEKTIVFGKSLNEIAMSDKNVYIQKFENAFDVSELQELTLENNSSLTSYTYNFKYIKQAYEYAIQIFWTQYNSQYYIISICIPQSDASKYQGIESEIISSFKVI